ncbi:putative aarF domain-containing protein kinase, chloroplastic, partial [Cucurbita argyrosperma subsp. argyrosperma]
MDVFLASISSEDYEQMASALIQMGATNNDVNADLDTEIARGRKDSTAVAANILVDERQMNKLLCS